MVSFNRKEVLKRLTEQEKEKRFKLIALSNLNLCYLDLSNLDLSMVNFEGSNLEGTNFYNSVISHSILNSCNLKNANFEKADLRSCKFDDSNLIGANFNDARMGGASLSRARVIYQDLMNAINVNLPIERGNLLFESSPFSEMKYNLSRKNREFIFIKDVAVYFDETNYDFGYTPLMTISGKNTFTIWLQNLLNPNNPSQVAYGISFYLAPIITLVENVIIEKIRNSIPDVEKTQFPGSEFLDKLSLGLYGISNIVFNPEGNKDNEIRELSISILSKMLFYLNPKPSYSIIKNDLTFLINSSKPFRSNVEIQEDGLFIVDISNLTLTDSYDIMIEREIEYYDYKGNNISNRDFKNAKLILSNCKSDFRTLFIEKENSDFNLNDNYHEYEEVYRGKQLPTRDEAPHFKVLDTVEFNKTLPNGLYYYVKTRTSRGSDYWYYAEIYVKDEDGNTESFKTFYKAIEMMYNGGEYLDAMKQKIVLQKEKA